MTASLLEQLHVEPAFVSWARGQSTLLEAFQRAPRGDWLIHLAMRVGIDAACIEGVLAITAGNYGGKLGPHHFHLRKLMEGVTA